MGILPSDAEQTGIFPCLTEVESVGLIYRGLGPQENESDFEKSGKGTAFLISDSHLITCAHVVAAAFGQGLNDGSWLGIKIPPGTKVRVQEANPQGPAIESVLRFYEPHDSSEDTADIAILELPAGQGGAVPFLHRVPAHGTSLRAYGFPIGHKKLGGWLDLRTSGDDAIGWLQVDKQTLSGLPAKAGISGAPVWLPDLSAVIGMITMAEESSGVIHIIPYDRIRQSAERIRCLPKLVASEREVFESLLKLDFEPQLTFSGQIAGKLRSAILVHGADEHGQQMLVERIKRRSNLEKALVLTVDLGRVTLRVNENKVHQGVARWLEIDPERAALEPHVVYQALAKRLRFKDTLILFLPDVQTSGEIIAEVIHGFWKPLIETLEKTPTAKRRLLVLIIDEFAKRALWGKLDVAQSPDQWRPEIPLELPALAPIDRTTLENWLLDGAVPIAQALTPSLVAELLYQRSNNGIPERVFNYYCSMRALLWTEVKRQWLRS